MIRWGVGSVPIRIRADEQVFRLGMVSEDGLWGLHLDGERINLTHMKSGKRLWRYRSLGAAASAAAELGPVLGDLWITVNPQDGATKQQMVEMLRILVKHKDA